MSGQGSSSKPNPNLLDEYDNSDSDYESENEFQVPKSKSAYTTSVLLGFADETAGKVDEKKAYDSEASERTAEPTVWDSRLGGQPIWLHPDSKPSKDLIICKNCKKPLTMLTQLYFPKPGTFYDRVIYVFVCRDSECRRQDGSIRCIKGIRRNPEEEKAALEKIRQEEEEEKARALDEERERLEKEEKQRKLGQSLFASTTEGSDQSNPFATGPFGAPEKQSDPFANQLSSNPFSNSSNPFGTPVKSKKDETPAKKTSTKISWAAVAERGGREAEKKPESKPASVKPEVPQPTSTESENIDPKFAYDTSEIPSFDISFYLDTDYENIDPRKFGKSIDLSKTYSSALTPEQIRTLLADADNEDDDVKSKGKGKGKGSDSAKTISERLGDNAAIGQALGKQDLTFQNFIEYTKQNNDQIIRHYRSAEGSEATSENSNLKPLLYSSVDTIGKLINDGSKHHDSNNLLDISAIPNDAYNKKRSIELQIMPYAISVLEENMDFKEMLEKGMEWGTIFVATPEDDDIPKLDTRGIGYTEEWVGVQWETQDQKE